MTIAKSRAAQDRSDWEEEAKQEKEIKEEKDERRLKMGNRISDLKEAEKNADRNGQNSEERFKNSQ